jgi:uncharacterized membrane protein YozB (DUF420 family)
MVYPIAGDESMFSPRWQAAVIVPKVSSVISIIASTYIIQSIMRSNEKKTKTTQRIMVALSASDICVSFTAYFLSTWPVPRGTIYGAVGNDASCYAQGVFNHMFACLAMSYNAGLALAFLLAVRYHWNRNALRKLEPVLLLIFPAIWCLIFITPISIAGAFGYRSINCYIGPTPAGCDQQDSPVDCDRGLNSHNLFIWCSILPTFLINLFIIICMVLLFKDVRRTEEASMQYRFAEGGKSISKEVGVQGLLYSCAYFLTWWPYYISGIMQAVGREPPFIIDILGSMILPLQGLFNALVYLRPAMTRRQERAAKYGGILIFILGPIILFVALLTSPGYQDRYYKSLQSSSGDGAAIVEDVVTAKPNITKLPDPPSNLEELCRGTNITESETNNLECFRACEVAECCYFPVNFQSSCLRLNQEVCAIYVEYCDNLI